MPYITIRGVEHYYEWISTSANLGSKPVMVFLHGWAGSGRYWESTAEALSDEFDCLLYDLRGFGRSLRRDGSYQSAASDYELEEYAHDLRELLDRLGLERVYLNSHSTGASIATFFLNFYPQRVEKAILTCSGVFEYDEKSFKAFHKFGGYVVQFRPPWLAKIPGMERMFMQRFLHRPIPGKVAKAFLKDYLLADYEAALNTIYTAVSKKAAEVMPQEFAKLQVPTLLVAGEKDLIIPPALGKQAASLNPQVKYVVMPKTAHFPMLEDASAYLKLVREFLEVGLVRSA
ncbi:alpha/beta fold hydrolase [Merismopedia glauca]|uniref:Alpha/beta hydrolase n=1 Tax=Merismopedia glauca CCAP 1448/3 TaxID=1296344 RepID=A0A2T1C8M4_9CYAN|nr:alpha/beta hydrolase [Merismopedia glauca]PSB04497.1 alpha/beta hydrolase [Merismopedia glauca CCAP 1448/3]